MRLFALAAALVFGPLVLAPACDKGAPPVPASSDPTGKDLVKGALVAAVEKGGGIRLYKIVHVDELPDPFGPDLHMIAYDPKARTFEEAAELQRKGGLQIAMPYLMVRLVNFMPRDHRVLAVEPVTDAEREPYLKARQTTR